MAYLEIHKEFEENAAHTSYCDLCCQPTCRDNKECTRLDFPGCLGLPLVLNKHLIVYFVAKKLLKLRDDQFVELITGGNKTPGEEESSFGDFCEKCDNVISEALALHRKINELGERLKEMMKLSLESCGGNFPYGIGRNSIARKIWNFMFPELVRKIIMVQEDREGISGTIEINVKAEVDYEDHQQDLESRSSMEMMEEVLMESASFSEETNQSVELHSHIENSNEHPYSYSLCTKQELDCSPLKRKRKKKDRVKDDETDLDSDYKPEEEEEDMKPKFCSRRIRNANNNPQTRNRKSRESKSSCSNTCNICGMIQNTPHGFRNHLKVHEKSTELYGNKYDCPKCKYPALSEGNLRFHMSKSHNQNNSTCAICGYFARRRAIYDKHMMDKHGIQTWIPIDPPEKDNNEQSTLTNDVTNKVSQTQAAIHQCEKCPSMYKSLEAFQRHQNDHKSSVELHHKFDCSKCKQIKN